MHRKRLHLMLEIIAFYGSFIKHCYISKGKNLKGFQFRQFRQTIPNWQILVGPKKNLLVGPGRPWSAQVLDHNLGYALYLKST